MDLRHNVNGTSVTPTRVVSSGIGSFWDFSNSASAFTFAGRSTVSAQNITMASIMTPTSTEGGGQYWLANSNTFDKGWAIGLSGSNVVQVLKAGVAGITSSITLTNGNRYAVVVSIRPTAACDFTVKDLATGAISTGSASQGSAPVAGDGVFVVGKGANGACRVNVQMALIGLDTLWTFAQQRDWVNAPYVCFRPIIRRRYFVPAAVAPGAPSSIFIQEHISRGIGRGIFVGR